MCNFLPKKIFLSRWTRNQYMYWITCFLWLFVLKCWFCLIVCHTIFLKKSLQQCTTCTRHIVYCCKWTVLLANICSASWVKMVKWTLVMHQKDKSCLSQTAFNTKRLTLFPHFNNMQHLREHFCIYVYLCFLFIVQYL